MIASGEYALRYSAPAPQTKSQLIQGVDGSMYLQTTETKIVMTEPQAPPQVAKQAHQYTRRSVPAAKTQVNTQNSDQLSAIVSQLAAEATMGGKQLVYCAEDGGYYMVPSQSSPSSEAPSRSQSLQSYCTAETTSQQLVYCAGDGQYYRMSSTAPTVPIPETSS
eukprot:CAMPEP_0169162968 /NCGR_PEP_ID=MMETSP1015-20121227/57990_1 /TAXON_ID=342587 /ORGANISM="Karlodinium micrum, Strain CCMP2283" /LENGTH=163 /DNA_ID=CAMNT_0009235185 /DNA_START=12 /DNA_END=500 /DNA_ORIENTATION=+